MRSALHPPVSAAGKAQRRQRGDEKERERGGGDKQLEKRRRNNMDTNWIFMVCVCEAVLLWCGWD